jgi:hypothetical protein
MIKLRVPTAEDTEAAQRQLTWRLESVGKLKLGRDRRRAELERREESITRALNAYGDLSNPEATVTLRAGFVSLNQPRPLPASLGGPELAEPLSVHQKRWEDWHTRPPATRLIMGTTSALPSYLSVLYVVHREASLKEAGLKNQHSNASREGGRESWAVLCGRWDSSLRARRARLARDLDELARADLVALRPKGQQGRYEGFTILRDDTSDKPYRSPRQTSRGPSVLPLPASFFRQGWHLVLTPAEIAVLLMAKHANAAIRSSSEEPGIGLPLSTRYAIYGVSGEAYGAIHELEEFGILTVHDTMPHRRHGKFRPQQSEERARLEADGESFGPVPYRLEVSDDALFNRPALSTVHRCLMDTSVPPRLSR